ncbi:aa3-type cytochrome c oxidase subunit IV [Rhizobium sp. SSA_523]|uniref:aa3-type cytochrome c oxidase subunit IV n=1 Tax=Rhizobium sp. SSA_523 TaxID=2952477 RepID=UPI00209109E3|nr:aa3-type cytochrome c oxidase subunit IV [Rhizobium sp. SSA_523]MCO5731847.1 aa3-type cytochrome c oxidase subunit IV [Rhizobium sp. SSA_523]WKC22790.1 aa3-type cytochrome c oxidase subunit IV [Rhizobium sp. SSA_523]
MDNHQAGPVETGAPMDYREHEKTYDLFLAGLKWGTMMTVVLLLAMVGGFFAGGGLFGGLILFIILNAAGFYLLR